MKKLFLIATLGVASLVSANTTSSSEKIEKLNEKKSLSLPIGLSFSSFPIYYTTSCGVAAVTYKTNIPTIKELFDWVEKLEQNYCGEDAPYSNNSGLGD